MAFLYGDSTESGLELNYIEYLKAALDLAIEVLQVEGRVQALQEGGEDRKRAADVDLGQLRQLSDGVSRAIETAPGGPDSPSQRCAAVIRQAAGEAIKNAVNQVKAQLAEASAALAGQVAVERAQAVRALESFLVHHDVAAGAPELAVSLDGDGARYSATMRRRSDIGLEWRVALDVPAGHLFAVPLKVERIAPHLEIQVPETGGWMRKGPRMKRERLGGKLVVELTDSEQQTSFKLRAAPHGEETGYNLLVTRGSPPIRLVRVARGDHSPPFEPLDEDVPRLLELTDRLRAELTDLGGHRSQVLDAYVDGKPLADGDGPSVVVRRLINALGPFINDIARHSLSHDELVLKRVLADGRREEIFVAKADLVARLEAVPPRLRTVFAPLGLGVVAPPPTFSTTRPPPPREERGDLLAGPSELKTEVGTAAETSERTEPTFASSPRPSPSRELPRITRPPPRPARTTGERQAARPSQAPPGGPSDEEDITVVGPAPSKVEVSVDAALSELERETSH